MSKEFTFEIKKRIGSLSEPNSYNGWKRELNIVAWNGGAAKYDIREWDVNHERMSKGITLTEVEAETLYRLLKDEFEREER